jgi:uncharacterized protein (DUF3820 family)
MILTDESPMPFGKYKNSSMADVPADYLMLLYNEGLKPGNVKDYIQDNIDVLKQQVKNDRNR